MAKIKIKEGSLDVTVGPNNGNPTGTAHYPGHTPGHRITVVFESRDNKPTEYIFENGMLVPDSEPVEAG